MDAIEYLQNAREKYLRHYRAALREKRNEGAVCTPEVWIKPNGPPDEQPPHPICVDIMVQEQEAPAMIMISGGATEGGLISTMQVGDVPVKLYALVWEELPVWVRHPEPDWTALEPWQGKWMNIDGDTDDDGLSGVVHYLGKPIAEGGGFLYQMDFGWAPVEALTDLLEVFAGMGCTEIELGRSDGSDIPADAQAQLQEPDLSMNQLAGLIERLHSSLPEVTRVQRVSAEHLDVYAQGDKQARQMYLGNLHRLLRRTGPEGRAKEVCRFMRGQRESMAPAEVPDLAQLHLVVKDDRFLENIRQHAPGMKPLVRQKVVADLWLLSVWDAPNGMRFTTDDEPEKYGMTREQMLARARTNYLEERPEVELNEHGPLLVAQTHDCYDATLLVDDQWWDEIAPRLQGSILACVPARHIVLIGGAGRAGTVEQMRKAAKRIEAGGDHLISNTILVRRDGKWEQFQEATSGAGSVTRDGASGKAGKIVVAILVRAAS